MLEAFYPGEYRDSAYGLPYGTYYGQGIRGVIFDIDNTLVPHGAPADAQAVQLFSSLREMGMKTCLLSNNKEGRVAPFGKAVGSPFLCKAGKPGRSGYRQAMERMGTDVSTTLFVGDQLFTDVYGANRLGIRTVLVKPIHPKEEIQIVLKRILERLVLWCYRRSLERRRERTQAGR